MSGQWPRRTRLLVKAFALVGRKNRSNLRNRASVAAQSKVFESRAAVGSRGVATKRGDQANDLVEPQGSTRWIGSLNDRLDRFRLLFNLHAFRCFGRFLQGGI